MEERLSRDEMYMQVAEILAKRGTCNRAEVGAVIVRGGRIISTGYVGAPSGFPHCLDIGCKEESGGCIRTVHAEANAIAFAAREGISVRCGTLYTTLAPCLNCARLIINAGIESLVFRDPYRDLEGIRELVRAGLEILRFDAGGRLIRFFPHFPGYEDICIYCESPTTWGGVEDVVWKKCRRCGRRQPHE